MKCKWLKSYFDDNGWENFECEIPGDRNCPFLGNDGVECEIKKVTEELMQSQET